MAELSDLLSVVSSLPSADVKALADAVREGGGGLERMRARTGSGAVRAACEQLVVQLASESGEYLAGWLEGAAAAASAVRDEEQVDVVWTGPMSEVDTGRFTSQVVIDLIDESRRSLLLASYATNPDQRIFGALRSAVGGGVDVTVLYERELDNPAYRSTVDAFADLPVRRLVWPAGRRPPGAALHPKFVVVDERVALVGSANLTGRALGSNLECGVLIRGGVHPKAITSHVWSLLRGGDLVNLASAPRPSADEQELRSGD